jgi:Tfp pilus assembly protein PilF
VDNNPAQLQASAYLGDCLVELNQYDQALAILEKTVHQSPAAATPAMVYRDLGIVYAEAGRKDEATGELEKAIALDPKDVSSHWRLARLYQSMGRKDEAKAEFDIASSMNKENSRPLTQEIGDSHPGAQP